MQHWAGRATDISQALNELKAEYALEPRDFDVWKGEGECDLDELQKASEDGLIDFLGAALGAYYLLPEWGRTVKRIMDRDDNQCQSCGKQAEMVHHLVLDRLGQENDYDLISLCWGCNRVIEAWQMDRGGRVTPGEIERGDFLKGS